MNAASPIVERIHKPHISRRVLFAAEILISLAALLAILAVQHLTPLTLTLFLVVAQACIIGGVLLYLAVIVTDFFRHHGVSQMHFAPGEVIFRQGDPGDFVYTIIDGQVEVIRKDLDGEEKVINRLGPGEYFGEMALVSNAPRTATVRAMTPVTALTLARTDFTALYTYLPDLHKSVERVIKQRQATTPVSN
jgi:hypothetical protein